MKAGLLFGAAIVAALTFLMWYDHATDHASVSWLDPQQPPPMLAIPTGSTSGRISYPEPYARTYPGCLADWPGSIIGSC